MISKDKAYFLKVASKVTHKFDDLIRENPALLLAFTVFSCELAKALFDD